MFDVVVGQYRAQSSRSAGGPRATGRVSAGRDDGARTELGPFARAYPDVVLDVTTTNEMRLDLVAGHFDAGIHLGEFIERDMIAVRVSPDQRAAIVGAPTYFKAHPKPKSPRDLTNHRCLNFRHGANETYRWEFDKGKQSLAVAVDGPLVVDDVQLLIRAAIDGVGLTFLMEEHAAPYLANGQLLRVLEEWCEPFPGSVLYYPSRRQQPAALAACASRIPNSLAESKPEQWRRMSDLRCLAHEGPPAHPASLGRHDREAVWLCLANIA